MFYFKRYDFSVSVFNKFILRRFLDTGRETYGVFICDAKPVCLTLELCWLGNTPNISCIPSGAYKARWVKPTEKIPYEHYVLADVPAREGIALHKANKASELSGCITVGMEFGVDGVLRSGEALDRFLALADREGVTIFVE